MTHKVKELFEFMESPWLLLHSEIGPALPATGVDVYIKEQQLKRNKSQTETTLSEKTTVDKTHGMDVHDKMFILTCHKNYRILPAASKKLYEAAAQYNAALRQELHYRLSSGCSRFETFCASVKEATVELIKQGTLP
uniref:Protein saf1 n=1 Tax=Lygus hesperus TaxID=30085 RepID=A0A0A9Y909_LYGHE